MSDERPVIGVLALQGAYAKHAQALEAAGADARLVKRPNELSGLDGLIIPGGESTTFLKHLERDGFFTVLKDFVRATPTFGTCAGAILLATGVEHPHQESLQAIDMTVERNAYGRQIDSTILTAPTELEGDALEMVFIRAPRIARVGPEVEVLARRDSAPVLVRQGHLLAATFHPELSDDSRVHRLFVETVKNSRNRRRRSRRTMKALAAFLMIAAAAMAASAQTDAPATPLATQLSEMLHRESDGHSPTPDEIQTVEALPGVTDAAIVKDLLPLLTKALADPDAHIRAYALAMLVGMQSLPEVPSAATPASPADGAPAKPQNAAANGPTGPGAYKSAVARALLPLVQAIGARLSDDDPDNRTLAATVLGGFASNPAATVYAPLVDFLKRDDASSSVGVAVVSALLQLGQPGADTASAIARYVQRGDLSTNTKASLVETIAAKPNQSQTVNKSLLGYLDADDAGLRSRLILSLPALDLSADAFAAAKAHVAEIAASGQDALQVVNAAKTISLCWTEVKMTTGCPVY